MKSISAVLAGILLLALAGTAWAADAESLIPNGGFEKANSAGTWPDQWPKPDGASWEDEEGNHFLRLTVPEPGKASLAYLKFQTAGGPKAYELRFKVRYKDVVPGAQPWFDGRVMMNFKDKAGKIVKGAPSAPSFRGSSDWVNKTVRLEVPEGADSLEIMFTLFQAKSGTLDFDDVKLLPASAPATTP